MTRREYLLLSVAAVLILAGLLLASQPSWLLHPLGSCTGSAVQVRDCKGYNVWSGIAGSCLTGSGIWTSAIGLYLHHQCKVIGCMRPGWHAHPDHGQVVCRNHHPDGHGRHLLSKHHQYEHTKGAP